MQMQQNKKAPQYKCDKIPNDKKKWDKCKKKKYKHKIIRMQQNKK